MAVPNASCPVANPDIIPPVSVPILTVLPTRESPLLNVRAFSFELKVFQLVAERKPAVVELD